LLEFELIETIRIESTTHYQLFAPKPKSRSTRTKLVWYAFFLEEYDATNTGAWLSDSAYIGVVA